MAEVVLETQRLRLRAFRGSDVQTIRFMEGRDATTRFGTGYVNGLIVVTTRTARGGPGGS